MTTTTKTAGQMIRRAVELALLIESEIAATKKLRAMLYEMDHMDSGRDGLREMIEEKDRFIDDAKRELTALESVA
jgi:hypothetical protein